MRLSALLLLLGCAHAPAPRRAAIDATLDDWHAAAAAADEDRYFSHFAADAVFFGTDPDERWTVAEFRAYAHPHFAKGKAWTFRPLRRAVFFSAQGATAWFDEDLATPNLGPARGTGVLVRRTGGWLIAQYNLSVPIPNALFKEIKTLMDRAPR